MPGPLHGVRIVEMTSVVLGPWAAMMLGDLGAEVIKIEPPGGDTNRNLGPNSNHTDMGSLYLTCNRNKRSIVLDLKSEDGRTAALKLCESADVVIHNFRAQAMTKLGLDYAAIKAVNPNVIYCATYGYSKDGPYGNKGALDDSIQAASGIAMLQSMVEGEPRYLPTIVADKTTALNVVQAVLAALFHRERSGEGQEIEVPMFESLVAYIMTEHLWGLTFDPPQGKAGYTRLMSKQRRPYKTKDGYLAVLPYWDAHWETFCAKAERPDMAADPRFINMRERLKNIDASYAATADVIATKTTQEWLDLLGDTNVPMMIVNTLDGLVDDEHLKAIGFWQMFDHPTEGKIRMSKPPINFSKTPADIRRLAPRLGENSAEILREAGYDDAKIEAMFESGATRKPA
jgi:crotonobetainyl-CoA:carnitine CoA-transferase CaiB-like acyl-CoA transferase